MVDDRVALVAEAEVERAGDLGEEVEVDQRPDHEVEDLLDDVAGEDPGERRAAHDGDVHHERHERPDVRGEEVVERHACRIRRKHGHVRDPARVRVAKDPVPAERGERRLRGLEDAAEDDVEERDLGDRVPQLADPAPDVDPREMEQREHDDEPEQP